MSVCIWIHVLRNCSKYVTLQKQHARTITLPKTRVSFLFPILQTLRECSIKLWANHQCGNISGGWVHTVTMCLHPGITEPLQLSAKRNHEKQLSIYNLCSNNTINVLFRLYGLTVGWRHLALYWRTVEWFSMTMPYSTTEHIIVINQYTFCVIIYLKTCLP